MKNNFIDMNQAVSEALVSQQTIRNWCHSHGIGHKVGGRYRIDPIALRAMLGVPSDPPNAVLKDDVKGAESRKGQTLRLSPEAWLALKVLASELTVKNAPARVTVHDLLIEGVNQIFAKHGKPRIAK